jgi:hypothetical protein
MQALTVHFRGNNSQLKGTISDTQRALAAMGTVIKGAMGVGIGAAVAGIAGAIALVPKAISKAAEAQDFETSFSTLLGGAAQAKERIAELSKFAAATPFELPEIVKASKVLETLTNGALATGAGLTMVGDIAASTGQPFDELAVHVGRLYSGLQSGRPVGEAMNRLMELGVISAEARTRIEDLQKSGKKGPDVWNVATQAFSRFAGEMDKKSKTWNGLWSTLQDGISGALREFGAPLIDGLTPMLQESIKLVESLVPAAKRAGEIVASVIRGITQTLKEGTFGEAVSLAFIIGIKKAINFLMAQMGGFEAALAQVMINSAHAAVDMLNTVNQREFWVGLQDSLVTMAGRFGAAFGNEIAMVLERLGPLLGPAGTAAAAFAKLYRNMTGENTAPRGFDMEGRRKSVTESWAAGVASAPQMDLSADIARLQGLLAPGGTSNAGGSFWDRFSTARDSAESTTGIGTGKKEGVIASSLAKIGGGGRYAGGRGISEQIAMAKEANGLLKNIEKNTAKPVSVTSMATGYA